MTLKIVSAKKNVLLNREEIEAHLAHHGKPVPPRHEVRLLLAKELNTTEDLVLVNKIFSIKGKGESRILAHAYKTEKDIPKERLEVIRQRMNKKKKGETAETKEA